MDLDHAACYRVLKLRDPRFDGRFFTAVKTTGIYCRPVCPARIPKFENVIFYPSAAAAQEAGYRPCLRCRPETAPDLGAWRGTSNTVSRALRLIEMGALDETDIEALATRLGLGERQLRRLFRQHLGASPVSVAQTRRVLLAKQLIHETQLPMAEIAFASGFGSIRRFNEVFHALYQRSPGALRRAQQPDVSAGPSGEISLSLRYRPPYDWSAMLEFLRRRAIPGIEHVTDRHYARSISLDGTQGIVRVESTAGAALRAHIRFPKLSALPGIIARLRRVFDLAADTDAIGAHLAQDPALAPLVKARPGLRVPGAWDGFELAVRAVLGQQITVAGAVRLAARLVLTHGVALREPHGSITHTFPLPAALIDMDRVDMDRVDMDRVDMDRVDMDRAHLGLPRSRADTLRALAIAVVKDAHFFDANRELDEAIAQLRSVRGVGDWTAQYIALRQLREPDAFPHADVGLIRALAAREGQARTASQLLIRADAWRPWRAYAAQHLWSSCQR
jgi:AraC family transcriptional regulator of adaptative response / DNA-3-methyladenine glycosylase II